MTDLRTAANRLLILGREALIDRVTSALALHPNLSERGFSDEPRAGWLGDEALDDFSQATGRVLHWLGHSGARVNPLAIASKRGLGSYELAYLVEWYYRENFPTAKLTPTPHGAAIAALLLLGVPCEREGEGLITAILAPKSVAEDVVKPSFRSY